MLCHQSDGTGVLYDPGDDTTTCQVTGLDLAGGHEPTIVGYAD